VADVERLVNRVRGYAHSLEHIQQLEAENRELAERVKQLEAALYDATVELCYVQEPGCGCEERHLCASGRGKDLVEKGMELLGVKDLSAETWEQARAALAGKKG